MGEFVRYLKIGKTGYQDLAEWRKLLSATAKTHDKYKFLKVKVLTPAINEINEVSNIYITLNTKKTGRSISHISFDVKKNTKANPLPSSVDTLSIQKSDEYKALIELKITSLKALSYLKEYGNDYIYEKIELLKSQKIKKSPAGFIISAIEKNWNHTCNPKNIDSDIEVSKAEKEKNKKNKLAK